MARGERRRAVVIQHLRQFDGARVTEELILKMQRPGGSWTHEFFRAVGEDVPPISGWRERIIGRMVDISKCTPNRLFNPDQQTLF